MSIHIYRSTQVQWTRPLTKNAVPLEGSDLSALVSRQGKNKQHGVKRNTEEESEPEVGEAVTLVRFGCSTDLRKLWKDSGGMLPKDIHELNRLLKVKEEVKRPVKRPTKQKRKAHRVAKGTTNAHLDR